MTPELRLIRYFVAVADEGNVTRAARRLHISQPSLSTALRRLEAQLGVQLLRREGRRLVLTHAGELLHRRGRQLLAEADDVTAAVRGAAAGVRLRLGVSPTARYELAPRMLALCAAASPGVMIYTQEDTSGALLRGVAAGALDAALTFCAGEPPVGVELIPVWEEPAVLHLDARHPLARRTSVSLAELGEETVLVADSPDSSGYTERIARAFAEVGVAPGTLPDPYPDLGLQAVREGRGVVLYVRSAYPAQLEGSAFVPVEPPVTLPFHLAVSRRSANAGNQVLIDAAETLRRQFAELPGDGDDSATTP